ncbi:PstC family ABC transporter permease [Allobaculum sp. Allo2]|uniref:PstC family ABC transporter permease n=1 Tax=Allobaculum sp. Allo2 TaxID=2853432 RepID=UPI001F60B1B1|nr:ABC transporter permease subunit [Allobaculum sp. Allo2]UNT93988.1 ABC transporter permease subunit [Allobaculum sp. Allo2]
MRVGASGHDDPAHNRFTQRKRAEKVDPAVYDGSRALGASHDHTVFFVCLPAAASGILSAIVLGIGRAVGETMAVIMVAGNAAVLPDSLLSPVRTLTTGIVLEMSYASGLHREALIAMGAVLFVLILGINLCFMSLKKRSADHEYTLVLSVCPLIRIIRIFYPLCSFRQTAGAGYHQTPSGQSIDPGVYRTEQQHPRSAGWTV